MAAQAAPRYRLGPRVPSPFTQALQEATRVVGRDIPSRIIERTTSTTSGCNKSDQNLCEKPASGSSMALPIGLGVAIPVVAIIIVLIYLHRRNVKKMQAEDNYDPHKSLDFGLAMDTTKAKAKRKSSFFGGEKDMFSSKSRQLSMDMGLASPYLLPPQVQSSRESLRSLARTLHQSEEDPYHPVSNYAGSDVASLRSFQQNGRGNGAPSVYARSMNGNMSRSSSAAGGAYPSRNDHLSATSPTTPRSRSPMSAPYPDNAGSPPAGGQHIMPTQPAPVKTPNAQADPFPKELDSSQQPAIAELQVPEPAASRIARKSISGQGQAETAMDDNQTHNARHNSSTYSGFELNLDPPKQDGPPQLTLGGPFDDEAFLPGQATTRDEPTLPSISLPGEAQAHAQPDEDHNRGHQRQSSEYPQDYQTNLGLPQADSRRLSVGVRPLPPDELIESEDPETRANRIRSFYKEYFDDGKPDMAEYNQHYPPNGIPNEWRGAPNGAPGNAPYFDPQSNSFVMPYAQPVSRRAMTPPPSGSRFLGGGPRGPPRNFHGSMGGMGVGPRPGSSMSSRYGGPRRPLPPPEPLSTLPTPSKLKDDSFALLNAMDFAPPPSMNERVAGRSQSPLGERRPYEMRVPVSTPLVSSFDEMAALPSPHVLRKSSTFTALDFAPPRKFKDPDTMSDAGSIRSNRSGISAVSQAAIRSGAGRVSRLPGDSVFTQQDLAAQLKPNWGMRP